MSQTSAETPASTSNDDEYNGESDSTNFGLFSPFPARQKAGYMALCPRLSPGYTHLFENETIHIPLRDSITGYESGGPYIPFPSPASLLVVVDGH